MNYLTKYLLLFSVSFLSILNSMGQIDTLTETTNFENFITLDYENKIENMGDEIDLSDENIELDYAEKWNINALNVETALTKLQMSDYQYYQLLKYIDQCGALLTIFELAAVEGFELEQVLTWLPYLKVLPINKQHISFKDLFRKSKNQLLIRNNRVLEEKKGYLPETTNGYLGSPNRLSFKYTFQSHERVSFGIAGEKDAGEQFFKGEQKKGFDWYSFHLQIKKVGLIKNMVLGDYRMQMGQGLVMGSGYLQGSGVGVRKIQSAIQQVTTMNESPIYRGAVAQIGNHKIAGTLFWGKRYDEKGTLGDIYGAEIQFQSKRLKMGMRVLQMKYSDTIQKSEKWYQLYQFQGVRNTNYGIDYRWIWGHTILFGEFGMSQGGGFGVIQGAIVPLDPMVKMVLMYRKYSANFHSIAGNGFSKNSVLQNEEGIYFATSIVLNKNSECELYTDCYQINWLRYLVDKPEAQLDIGSKLKWNISRNSVLLFQYRYKTESKNLKNQYYNEIENRFGHRIKLVLQLKPHPIIYLKSELSISIYDKIYFELGPFHARKKGVLLYQDLGLKWEKPKLQIWGRVAYFDTDSYDERLYAYENDLTYCFTINSYYYQGFRWYLLVKYRIGAFDFQLRVSRTIYDNKTVIGSGLEEIQGNSKTEIKGQVIIKL